MFVVCGLGNPGQQYERTRHNVGFLLVDALAQEAGCSLDQFKHGGHAGRCRWNEHDLLLFKPQSYMNLSGGPVSEVLRFYKLTTSRLICICDDLDQQPLAVRVRKGGGHGGNNGLRDLLRALPDDGFHRIKIGIGKPEHKGATKDWVLSPFSATEMQEINGAVFDTVKDRIQQIIRQHKDP
jgi:PTH1 family peptidyl-tRNA hydrolase